MVSGQECGLDRKNQTLDAQHNSQADSRLTAGRRDTHARPPGSNNWGWPETGLLSFSGN